MGEGLQNVLGQIESKLWFSPQPNVPIDLQWGKCCETPSFLIGSSLNLPVMRTGIKSRTSLILGHIRLFALELLALEQQKCFTHTYTDSKKLQYQLLSKFKSHLVIIEQKHDC